MSMSARGVTKGCRRTNRSRRIVANLPSFSGKQSAIVLGGCLALAALLFPFFMRRPTWLEVEFVLLAWWVVWCVALTSMLFTGRRLVDDYLWTPPRSNLGRWFKVVFPLSDGDFTSPGGILVTLAFLLLLALVLVGLWMAWEALLPAVAIMAYRVVYGMMARIINDSHNCKGNVSRSILWGGLWATVYTAPLAALAWALHFAVLRWPSS